MFPPIFWEQKQQIISSSSVFLATKRVFWVCTGSQEWGKELKKIKSVKKLTK